MKVRVAGPVGVVAGLLTLQAMAQMTPKAQPNQGAQAWTYQVVHVYPHDRAAFTQGLIYLDGYLWEGTGMNGRSSIRQVELETGRVVRQKPLQEQFFGEGLTAWGKSLIEITYVLSCG